MVRKLDKQALEVIANILIEYFNFPDILRIFTQAKCYVSQISIHSSDFDYYYETLCFIRESDEGLSQIRRFLEILCDPRRYIDQDVRFTQIRSKINQILKLDDYIINAKGKIEQITSNAQIPVTPQVQTSSMISYLAENDNDQISALTVVFENRDYHSLIVENARPLFIDKHYQQAVFESCKAFDNYVKSKSGLNETGADLMGKALRYKNGKLKVNAGESRTEQDKQKGIMHLAQGFHFAFRNPGAHEISSELDMDIADTLDILSILNYLLKQLDRAVIDKTE